VEDPRAADITLVDFVLLQSQVRAAAVPVEDEIRLAVRLHGDEGERRVHLVVATSMSTFTPTPDNAFRIITPKESAPPSR